MTEFEDKLAIREVFSEYCFRMDDGDFAGVAGLFAPDGRWAANYESAAGRDDIESVLTRINPDKETGPVRKHMIANGLISLSGDTASARTSYMVLMDQGDGPRPIIVGTYVDELVRLDGSWFIADRRLVHEIAGDLGLRLDQR